MMAVEKFSLTRIILCKYFFRKIKKFVEDKNFQQTKIIPTLHVLPKPEEADGHGEREVDAPTWYGWMENGWRALFSNTFRAPFRIFHAVYRQKGW